MEDAQSYLDRSPSTRVDDKELARLRAKAAAMEKLEPLEAALTSFEWHVGETFPNGRAFSEDLEECAELRQIHWMPDPGDGLCSSIGEPMPKSVVEFLVAARNAFLDGE